ncbi:MAG TPA: heme lyase CcmF/NrfE family subunit [Solirubrobacteraceae bacterium]|nr:heme lyase CcmF/NrfE family subunit [Solirubrobacteraceae bacterium]
MATLGRACLILALGVCVFGVGAGIAAWRLHRRDLAASARRAVYSAAALLTIAMGVLEAAFLRNDFSFDTVASHSSTTTPLFYKAAAVWSSQEGSLLLWVWLLALWSSAVLFLTRKRMRDVTPIATAVLAGFATFFAALLVFAVSPFDVSIAPTDGSGLNPLLRHPSMMIHPPMLYSGYTLFTVPFAFAVGALVAGRVDAEWITATRRFALAAWLFLGIGIVLGARWSYAELGWGGYWAWDPVENASLLPWLTGTAFIHSIMIQEKRGMLKVWNVSLILGTGILAILGTFLVRSGILESIHAFGASTLGIPFVALIITLIAGSIALVVWRLDLLRSEHRLDSLLSREALFLFNNLAFVGLAFVIFFGTFFPLMTEALGNERSVGPPWFNRITVPLALALVGLAGLAPLIAWRRATAANLRRSVARPAAVGVTVTLVLAVTGVATDSLTALAMFGLAAFLIAGVAQEFWRGTRARRATSGEAPPLALVSLVRRNRRRYGGYTVHVGMALLFVGVAASSAFQHARDVRLRPGQTANVGGYQVRYDRPTGAIETRDDRIEKIVLGADLTVTKGDTTHHLSPSRGYYPQNAPFAPVSAMFDGEATSEVRMVAGLRRDFWSAVQPDIEANLLPAAKRYDAALREGIDNGQLKTTTTQVLAFRELLARLTQGYAKSNAAANFRIISSPLVAWIWIGGIVVFLGGLIAIWPAPGDAGRRRAGARYAARVAKELGRGERDDAQPPRDRAAAPVGL